ncbi:putative Ras GTPase-activating protein 4B [Exaiptasia diaphana]|nr:putative Ras GTPase-activating protein 4B [Exaiptasia diaphana]
MPYWDFDCQPSSHKRFARTLNDIINSTLKFIKTMEKDTTRPKYCGNLLARRTKRRSFINKLAFEGVFGVLSNSELMYFRSSSDWTNQEKPQFSMQLVDIQAVEEVDDVAFSRPSCFQVIHTSRSKKDKSIRSVYLAAYEEDEQKSWIKAIRSACLHNPIVLAYFHSGRFTGKTWTCCSEGKLHHGCKPCTIEGSQVYENSVVSAESPTWPRVQTPPPWKTYLYNFSVKSDVLIGWLSCVIKDDRLTVTEAAGKQEWKAFSASSTSEYGIIPCQSVSVVDISQEPCFFKGIPSGLVTALLREQEPGCFILRCHSASDANILSFRTEMAIKHVEIAFDESSQKFRIKDGSESVSYVNFLQFDTVQQLLDQCKQHPSKW